MDNLEMTEEITLEQFADRLKAWSERTSTSPSGRHLGHYKALARKLWIKEADEDWDYKEISSYQSYLLQCHHLVVKLCLKHGYSLKRWQNVVNVMILKEPNNHKIHRLRVIHLFEADYNLILSVKWRQL